MILMKRSELAELVEELRAMAAAAPDAHVRDALARLADRYAAKILGTGRPGIRPMRVTAAPASVCGGTESDA